MPSLTRIVLRRLAAAAGAALLALAMASTTNLPPARLDDHSSAPGHVPTLALTRPD